MTPPFRRWPAAFIVLLLLCPARGDISLEELRTKNAASQAAVLTLQAHVEVSLEFNRSAGPSAVRDSPPTATYVIEYIRSGNKERTREQEGPLGVRDLIRDFESGKGSLFWPKQGEKTVNEANLNAAKKIDGTVEVWQWALFALPDTRQPLSELLSRGEVKTLKQTAEGGRDSVYLDVRDSEGQHYEIWVDPSTNYLVRKLVFHWSRPGGKGRSEGEVLSFREVRPGVFFPDRVRHALFGGDTWFEKGEATLTNLRVNEPLPAGVFQHVFPIGTLVVDSEEGKGYVVGPGGQPTHVGTLASPPPAESAGNAAPLSGTSTPPDADEGGWSWHHFLLLGSGILLAAGLAALLWKRRRKAET